MAGGADGWRSRPGCGGVTGPDSEPAVTGGVPATEVRPTDGEARIEATLHKHQAYVTALKPVLQMNHELNRFAWYRGVKRMTGVAK